MQGKSDRNSYLVSTHTIVDTKLIFSCLGHDNDASLLRSMNSSLACLTKGLSCIGVVGLAVEAFLEVELFMPLSAFHFVPGEDAHEGSYGGAVLDVPKEWAEFGGSHGDSG